MRQFLDRKRRSLIYICHSNSSHLHKRFALGECNVQSEADHYRDPCFVSDLIAVEIIWLIYPVLVSSLFTLGIVWYVMQTLPGFVESFGYLFGILLAYFTFDVQRDLD